VISAKLLVQDDNPADDQAFLVREAEPSRPTPQVPLPPEVDRLVRVYVDKRLGPSVTRLLPIVGQAADLKDAAGIVYAPASRQVASNPMTIVTNAITNHVDFKSLPATVSVGNAPNGWTPVVSFSGHPAAATNPDHPRQMWVGFDAANWAMTPGFVIFWTNVLDYAGGGEARWTSHPLADWTSVWKLDNGTAGEVPGVYTRSDGVPHAFNASPLPEVQSTQSGWKAKLAELPEESVAGELAPALLIAALGLLVLFALR
jgi:hypothetical protein